ncbi:hypothetical protein Tel_02900 [Candidatus Tenderia electrophaga]|uniref:Methyltransferase FkbM domain-containing protein n=1 Tax=Candidatus Tenderia electrophaga TaxID=1748243 RepID=A0A0S2TAL7_9GAMM|nr:hypothetical protein Tel_02900 [Candidatus Tenderia electrophaga]
MSNLSIKLKRELVKGLAKLGLRQVKSDYLGMPLRVPVVQGVVNSGFIVPAELWMGQCLKTFLETKAGAVIDIGVNAGVYLVKLRQLSTEREYIGFEPNPSCNLYTQELIRLNQFEAARIFPVALSDNTGTARFYATEIGDKTGSLVYEHKAHEPLDHSFDVVTNTGDEMLNLLKPQDICAIKIDVEEAELFVLRGLSTTIDRHRPYIYCEVIAPDGDKTREQRTQEIYQLVTSKDYAVLGVRKDRPLLTQVDTASAFGAGFEQEYIFCPAECVEPFCNTIKHNATEITVDVAQKTNTLKATS